MTEKRNYNSSMNSKGLEASITEDQARHLCQNQGTRVFLIVEAHAGRKVVAEDGAETIQLVPDLVEMVPSEHVARVREFRDALYARRPEVEGQAVLQGADIPDADAAAEGLDPAQVWDGNPDAPLRSVPSGPDFTGCDFPGCTLEAEHDGDHATEDQG